MVATPRVPNPSFGYLQTGRGQAAYHCYYQQRLGCGCEPMCRCAGNEFNRNCDKRSLKMGTSFVGDNLINNKALGFQHDLCWSHLVATCLPVPMAVSQVAMVKISRATRVRRLGPKKPSTAGWSFRRLEGQGRTVTNTLSAIETSSEANGCVPAEGSPGSALCSVKARGGVSVPS